MRAFITTAQVGTDGPIAAHHLHAVDDGVSDLVLPDAPCTLLIRVDDRAEVSLFADVDGTKKIVDWILLANQELSLPANVYRKLCVRRLPPPPPLSDSDAWDMWPDIADDGDSYWDFDEDAEED